MYTRLVILSVIIVAAVCGLGALGYHAIGKWAQGLEGARLGEFAEVAEQVRQDVKRKLDEFIRAEQQRKYTDYLYSYVPENVVVAQQQLPLLRSPLGNEMYNGIAYGYFQIEPDGSVVTPYYPAGSPQVGTQDRLAREVRRQIGNIWDNVVPLLNTRAGVLQLPSDETRSLEESQPLSSSALAKEDAGSQAPERKGLAESKAGRAKAYPIESLKQETQEAQVFRQQRSVALSNRAFRIEDVPPSERGQDARDTRSPAPQFAAVPPEPPRQTDATQQIAPAGMERQRASQAAQPLYRQNEGTDAATIDQQALPSQAVVPPAGPPPALPSAVSDTVQIRVEPFVPLVVPGGADTASIFGGQVFLLRHVQIEDRHLLQGFQLDEQRLIAEVEESAGRCMRDGMGFELPQVRTAGGPPDSVAPDAAYTAILDFGFGDLILSLLETDPHWIARRIGELHQIYFAIIAIVVLAVGLALASLWHNVRAQVVLARKKDDFISAVSHELRTPLTSIRMYAEMLEKNWVKSADKLGDYYRTMRQESERLSRLVENVLDFARLQKGRKRYHFELGDMNDCIGATVEMMRPYAEQQGFTIQTHLGPLRPSPFDRDAVTQIVVNLIDNAVKYARCAAEKTVVVRTRADEGFTIIEVEDHGPGIPHRQRKKVFEQFYRIEGGKCEVSSVKSEEARPTANLKPDTSNSPQVSGTGLGLTLVQRFAEAHGGYAEIDSAQPTGVIFRVALATQLSPGS